MKRASLKIWILASTLLVGISGCENVQRPDPPVRSTAANSELLGEMFQVVFLTRAQPSPGFASYLENLGQGASLEGIYNGFTHSAEYRRLENAHSGSTERALAVFTEELEEFERSLPERSVFDLNSAKPLQVIDMRDEDGVPAEIDFQTGMKPPLDPAGWQSHYARLFRGASIFTLKRVLGDEGLKVLASKSKNPRTFSEWYGKWAARIAAKNFDFGLSLRNRADPAFHQQWALKASNDLITWEVLNRVHRMLNEASKTSK